MRWTALVAALTGCGRLGFDGAASGGGGDARPDGTGINDAGKSIYATAVLADDPVSYWRLNDSDTTARNEVAGGPSGTYEGDCVYGEPGAVADDAAVRFDGVSTRITFGNVYGFGGHPYSAEAWLNSEDNNNTRFLFYRYSDDGVTGWQFYYGVDYFLHSRVYGGNETDYSNSNAPPPAGWAHAVATFDGDRTHVYINGEAFDEGSSAGVLPDITDGVFVVGDSYPGQFNKINGRVDEIAIYDKALTLAQVQAHYAASGR